MGWHLSIICGQEHPLAPAFFKNYDLDDYHASCQNWDLTVAKKGTLIVGNNTGLLTFDGNNWHVYKLPDKSEILHVAVYNDTIYTQNEKNIGYWIKNENGLLSYYPLTKTPSHVHFNIFPDFWPYPLPDEVIKSIPSAYATIDGYNYTGTLTNGIFVTDNQGNLIHHITNEDFLQDNIVHAIYAHEETGQIWIAFDNGITLINLYPAIRFLGKRNKLGKLENAVLHGDTLYVQTNIGSYMRNIDPCCKFVPISPEKALDIFPEENLLPQINIKEIVNDTKDLGTFINADQIYPVKKNTYWFTADNEAGLFSIDHGGKAHLSCRILFNNYDQNLVTRGCRIVPLNDSLHIFSTMQGIVLINTNILVRKGMTKTNPLDFSVISYIRNGEKNYLDQGKSQISLPYNFQKLNIYVKSTTFTPNNQISYKIENVMSDWSPWQKEGYISSLQLPEGKYKLKVRKYVPTGNFPEITLYITIRPPWYNTIWAYVIYIALLWIFMQTVIYYHLKNLRKEEQLQEETRKQEEEQRTQQLRNELLETELLNKNNELMLQTSLLVRKSRLVHSLLEELDSQKESMGERYPNKLYHRMKSMMEDSLNDKSDWLAFEHYFNSAHQHFIERLRTKYSEITTGDLRICCLLRMNLSTKEIASILNVSIRAVELRRYRLRKRLELDADTNLVDFLMNF